MPGPLKMLIELFGEIQQLRDQLANSKIAVKARYEICNEAAR